MSEAPTPPVPAQAEKATTSPVADLNAKTARRQKLLLGTLTRIDGVSSVRSSFVLQQILSSTQLPLQHLRD